MKGHSQKQSNTRETLPLERGGKRVDVKEFTSISRGLRKNSTDTERHLWRYLWNRQMEGFKFLRQQQIGRYVVDFGNLEKKLVIELDGGQPAINIAQDKVREEWLRDEGYKVLRLWDNELLSNLEGVLETIRKALLIPHPDPLPQETVS